MNNREIAIILALAGTAVVAFAFCMAVSDG